MTNAKVFTKAHSTTEIYPFAAVNKNAHIVSTRGNVDAEIPYCR
jgi:hypothetical protein